MKKHILLFALMLSVASNVFAEEVQIDGLWYNLEGTTAEVIQYKDEVKYSGDIVIPSSVSYDNTDYDVTSIGESAFTGCSGLTSIAIPNSMTSIGYMAFYECSGLTSITIPNSVTSIEYMAFRDCSGLTSIVVEEGNTKYDSRNNCNAIIETSCNWLITGCMNTTIPSGVTTIQNYAFQNCTGLTSITIPNSVTTIGGIAFDGCTGLTSITIPSSVTTIGDYAFLDCTSLTSMKIPNSVSSIGYSTFQGCSGLTSIVVEEGNINYDSRNNCNAIIETASNTLIAGCMNTTIPSSVTSIGSNAFRGCDALISITIPNSVTSIGDWAFGYCSGLTSITFPNNVTSIGMYAFYNCSVLTSITIPNNVTSIEQDVFSGCSGLTSITIPNSVKNIGDRAFADCSGLTSITIPNSVTNIGDRAFDVCTSLTSITIPSSVRTIGNGAFEWCTGLTSITIPNSVTSIENDVFRNCSGLTSITIPNSVTNIGDWAFENCSGLTDIYCYPENVPATGSYTFRGTPLSRISLHVSEVSTDAYKTTNPWSVFKKIVEFGYLNAEDLNIITGDSNTQEISLSNSLSNLVGFQMDLTLPEGIGIDKTGCSLSDRITDEDQELTIGKLESGAYRITSTSLSLTPISGNEGTLFSLKLTAEDGCIGGQATISNIIFSTAESDKIKMSDKTFDISILYNLTYKVDDEEYKTSDVAYGAALTPEAEPIQEGYTFSGWSEIPETMPAQNVTITGTFSANSYTLTYMVDGEIYKTYEVEYGSVITPETEPTKEGHTFSDWSEIPETMPASDVTITGQFYLYGDVNTDDKVNVVDVVDIARFVVATPSVNFREKLADLNFDNIVNIADAVSLVNYIAGDQNFAKAMTPKQSYDYDLCQLQLLGKQDNALSLCLDGDADFTAFQFEVELPENTEVTAMSINGQRKNGHQLLFNKMADSRYRVTALSLSNEIFKGNEGELLSISIDGLPTEEISVNNVLFVTKNGTGIAFDDISLSGTVTEITDVNVNVSEGNNMIFDLLGRQLPKVQRGINIINGKKVYSNK